MDTPAIAINLAWYYYLNLDARIAGRKCKAPSHSPGWRTDFLAQHRLPPTGMMLIEALGVANAEGFKGK